jgi:hypothetical protein
LVSIAILRGRFPEGTYRDLKRDEWQMKILPAQKKMPLPLLLKESGMSRSALKEIRAGRSRPHPKNQKLLVSILRKHGLV